MTAPITRQRAHALRKLADGWRRIDVWFSPEDLARLSGLAGSGSEQEAVRRAVRYAFDHNKPGWM